MSIQHIAALFNPRTPLVDQTGAPSSSYATALFNAIMGRTGLGTGIVPIVSAPTLVATGLTISTALQLTADWNDIEGGAVNTGVAIASALNLQPGNDIWVFNGTATNKNVYPPSAQVQIDGLGNGTPYVLGAGKLRCFMCWQANQFRSYGN